MKYSKTTIFLHWLSAFFILGVVPTGMMLEEEGQTLQKILLYRIHFGVGVIVCVLSIWRVVAFFTAPRPANLYEKGFKYWVVKITHTGLYISMLNASILGLLSILLSDFLTATWSGNIADLPLEPQSFALSGHRVASKIFFILLITHFVGAFLHYAQVGKKTFERIL